MSEVADVYSLVAKRDLSVMLRIREMATAALPGLAGSELLALHEAIVYSLNTLVTELGEHGLQNLRLIGIDAKQINLRQWVDECASSWKQVETLRSEGQSSNALIEPYMGKWRFPIGSADWLKQMRLSVEHHGDPSWSDRVSRKLNKR
jgi:hypothetical protein